MTCTWLGQAGLLFDFDGTTVMVDPYLSDSIAKSNPAKSRKIPVDESFLNIRPDVLIPTHDHIDHTDPETLDTILGKNTGVLVLASQNAWSRVRTYGNDHNYVVFNRGTQWTTNSLSFRAVHAQHSDSAAIGVLITYKGETYYVSGDTLYHNDVIKDVLDSGHRICTAFLPVNGVGNNMNMADAAQLAQAINSQKVVPVHFGLIDDLDPAKDFPAENKVIPQIYKVIGL